MGGLIDILVGALVCAFYWKAKSAMTGKTAEEKPSPLFENEMDRKKLTFIVIVAFTISGFCSLAYEVLWTRVLSLVLGSSVYAFTIMLATFLAGIGIGSIAFAPFVDRPRRPVFWFAVLA